VELNKTSNSFKTKEHMMT